MAASSISSSSGSSRDKNRLRFLKDAPAAEVVAALLHRDPLDQVDRTPEHPLQRFLEVEESGRIRFGVGFERDQQIGVAAVGVEILLAGGRAENLQPPDVEAPA